MRRGRQDTATGMKIILAVAAVVFLGWGINVYELVAESPELAQWGAEEVVRVIGVPLVPVGAFMGYFF